MTNSAAPLDLLYLDPDLIALDKPTALAVHRSRLVGTDEDYLMDRLRLQVDGPLHAVHRLDRATGSSFQGEAKPALTRWRRLATIEVSIAQGRYAQQRYALLEVSPETGRYRQIRRHFHHVSHHLLGDTSHGRGDHNRLIRQHYGVHRLMLHAWRLRVEHPATREPLQFQAPLDREWLKLMQAFGWTERLAAREAELRVAG